MLDKIKNKSNGIVLYGVTPPKARCGQEDAVAYTSRHLAKIDASLLDGLIVYDVQKEDSRSIKKRPYPYEPTLDSYRYSCEYLKHIALPKIIYRAVGRYSKEELTDFLHEIDVNHYASVFVGAASRNQSVQLSLALAYALHSIVRTDLVLGGVVIPERHQKKQDEHFRVLSKIKKGCQFFISQGVYDVELSKQFILDYSLLGQLLNQPLCPIIFTFSPCGSNRTLDFIEWLGISVPAWLRDELRSSNDILDCSMKFAQMHWEILRSYAAQLGVPVGCHVESISTREEDVAASIELLSRLVNQKSD